MKVQKHTTEHGAKVASIAESDFGSYTCRTYISEDKKYISSEINHHGATSITEEIRHLNGSDGKPFTVRRLIVTSRDKDGVLRESVINAFMN